MRFLPDAANQVVSLTIPATAGMHLWSAWPQLGVTALWAAVLVGIGAFLFRKRDAIGADRLATTALPDVRLAALPHRCPLPAGPGAGAIASEFTKLRSVRSTYWTLGALFIVSVGLGIAIAAGTAANFADHPFQKVGFDATQTSLGAFFELGQLIIAVIGAMVITSEYSTGMIRTSLTAQPRRGVVYAAKAIAFGAVALVISVVTAFVAFLAGQAMYASSGVGASLFHAVKIPANGNVSCLHGVPAGRPHQGQSDAPRASA